MTAQVIVLDKELPDGAVMIVPERQVILADGTTVILRRFWHDGAGKRVYLADERWLAQRGGDIPHLYACPVDAVHGSGAVWLYRGPGTYPTWEEALAAALDAEAAEQAKAMLP